MTTSDIVTEFLMNTTRLSPQPNYYALKALHYCTGAITTGVSNPHIEVCSASTGSNSEFYIEPMLSCVGDRDVMYFDVFQLAVPQGYPIPSTLPPEFHTLTRVFKIVDSGFAGYVHLVPSHFLFEDIDEGTFKIVECNSNLYLANNLFENESEYELNSEVRASSHGPATAFESDAAPLKQGVLAKCLAVDFVRCVRCLAWPPQAANWPKRLRNYGWPDSATLDCVVNNGCDVVPVAHPLCRQHKWMSVYQWRLSFSRAETVLLNRWTPVQQITYHMLRVFVKIQGFTDSATSSAGNKLSNYHIKTLMLWSSELKPSTWWSDDPNLIRICVELLHILSTQMTDARCEHYFLDTCNLFPTDRSSDEFKVAAALLASLTEASLAQWFVDNYIKRCCQKLDYCKTVAPLFNSISNRAELNASVTALINCRLRVLPFEIYTSFHADQCVITRSIGRWLFNVRSIVNFISQQKIADQRLFVYAAASVFLHAACEIQKCGVGGDFDNYVEVLRAVIQCFSQSCPPIVTNSRRRFLSRNLLRKAVQILKSVANKALSAMDLIEIELAKAYLYKTLRCEDSDSDSIFCLANVYLAVLYYASGQYQTAIDHCSLVTRSQDHSYCNSHVVQGELLPKIDDDVDNVLGLAVFYQYLRRELLNQPQRQHVSVFTTEIFAHFLHVKCHFALNVTNNIPDNTLADVRYFTKRYVALGSTGDLVISDVLLLKTVLLGQVRQFRNVGLCCAENCFQNERKTEPRLVQDTSALVGLLQQSAVELLTSFRHSLTQDFAPHIISVTNDFEALYAFHRGQYRRCIRLCKDIVDRLFGSIVTPLVSVRTVKLMMYPEFMQLMDDDIVSLFGLMLLIKPTVRESELFETHVCISQLTLALYLLAQSQIKLNCFPVMLFDTNLCTRIMQTVTAKRHPDFLWEQLVLKLTERRIAMYRRMCISERGPISDYDRQSFEEFVEAAKALTIANA